jgi:hypothetical protein
VTRAGHIEDVAGPAQRTAHTTAPYTPNRSYANGGSWNRSPSGAADAESTTWTREKVQAAPYMRAAIQTAQQMRDDLESQHGDDYQAIVDAAADQCRPGRPLMMADGEVSQVHTELLATIGGFPSGMRNQAAQRVMSTALDGSDYHTLYVLLSGSMDRAYAAWGDVNGRSLRTIYAQHMAATFAPAPGSFETVAHIRPRTA